jgi:hypothetical protein
MPYMLVRLEVAYGRTDEFSEVMSHLVPILESKGWRLHGAFVNRIGRLNRCYDLWEMPDANAVQSVLQLAAQEPEFAEWSPKLNELLLEEELELMSELPYYRERKKA